MKSPLPDPGRFASKVLYSVKEAKKIRMVLGNRDAYLGSSGDALEIDHRVPVLRLKGAETKVDVSDKHSINATYQLLTSSHNTHKREICKRCVRTGSRPPFLGIPFWFAGTTRYSTKVGCNGCGWAYPDAWKSALAGNVLRNSGGGGSGAGI